MALPSRTIRLFVSSTFSDLKAERNALQAAVFPRLQQHCQAKGWSFQAIDLRWGVSTEALLDQSALRTCLAEIARCQQVTPRPNFLVLLGDRYGARPLPDAVPAAELDALRHRLSAEVIDKLVWRDQQADTAKGWYRLDENAVVPLVDGTGLDRGVYQLRARTGCYTDDGVWLREVEQPLGAALRVAARSEWPDPTDARRLKFEASATEQEIVAGALGVMDASEHVRAYFRTIVTAGGEPLRAVLPCEGDLAAYGDFIDLIDSDVIDADAQNQLRMLKERLRRHINHQQSDYIARWQGNGISTDHLHALIDDVYASLVEVIDAQIAKHEAALPADEESLRHWDFAAERARDFTGRADDLAAILAYVRSIAPSAPMIVSGASGSGKSALLAQVALALRAGMGAAARYPQDRSRTPVVIARFIGATPGAGNIRTLLEGLYHEIGLLYAPPYRVDKQDLPSDLNILAETFRERLEVATSLRPFGPTAERPLVLLIDALDELPLEVVHVLAWLPRQLGPHLRIVVSTLSGALYDELMRGLPGALRHELGRMSDDDARPLLARWLTQVGRRLTVEQCEAVLARFAATGLPLYLRLAFETARYWRSHDAAISLRNDVPGVIHALFDQLSAETKHGALLVNRVLAYLACSRRGLSERELLQLLARDEAYWQHFLSHARHELPIVAGAPVRQLPVVIWSRLFRELAPYLSWREGHGTALLTFFHPTSFIPVVQHRFLALQADRQMRHAAMADYFVEAARGDSAAWPLASDNVRGFAECVYHLVNAGELDDCARRLTDLGFVAGKIRHGLVFELRDDYALCIGAMPEAQKEVAEEQRQRERLVRWAREITEYARGWSVRRNASAGAVPRPEPQLPEPPPTCRIWTEDEIVLERARLLERPTRLDQVRVFSAFVGRAIDELIRYGRRDGFVAQHALAIYPSGPVHEASQALARDCQATILVRRWPQASITNFRPALLCTIHDQYAVDRCFDVTPEGRLAFTGKSRLGLWDLDSRACLRILDGHRDPGPPHLLHGTNCVCITPDGRRAVSGGQDQKLRVWDLDTGACLRVLEGHYDPPPVEASGVTTQYVWCLAVTPDSRLAVSGGADKALRVWDLESGACLHKLQGHDEWVLSVSVTPDGRRAVSTSYDETLRVWDLEKGICVRMLKGHGGALNRAGVTAVCVTPDGRRAVSGSDDKTVRVWDLDAGACVQSLYHDAGVRGLSITPDGLRAVSASRDDTLRVWDLKTGSCLRTLQSNHTWLGEVRITADGRRAVASAEHLLQVWNLENGVSAPNAGRHSGLVSSISVTRDGRRALSGSYDKTLLLWDLVTGTCTRPIALDGHDTVVDCVAVTPDGRQLVSASNGLHVWDLDTGSSLRTFGSKGERFKALTLLPEGRHLVSGGWDENFHGLVRVWDIDSGSCLRTLEGHQGVVNSVCVTPDGHRVLSGSEDRTLRVWDIHTGRCLRILGGDTGSPVRSVSITSDGRRAISNGLGDLRIWDLETGACLRTIESCSTCVEITPDGRHALCGCEDRTLRIWDIHTTECLAVYSTDSLVSAVASIGAGNAICAGTISGELLVLEARGLEYSPVILTPTANGIAWCVACGSEFRAATNAIAAIDSFFSSPATLDLPPWSLPEAAFADPRLLSRCPHCDAPIKFNPFFTGCVCAEQKLAKYNLDPIANTTLRNPPLRIPLDTVVEHADIPLPSPYADANGARLQNLEYQRQLAAWKALPLLQRLRTARPSPPTGV